MARLIYHRVRTVGSAQEGLLRMRVDVGYDRETSPSTHCPECTVGGSIEVDDPCVKGMCIEVIVEDEPLNAPPAPVAETKQERPTFAASTAPTAKLGHSCFP